MTRTATIAALLIAHLSGVAVGWWCRRDAPATPPHPALDPPAPTVPDDQLRADERRTLARELNDVAAQQLSRAALQLMGHRDTDDAGQWEDALRRIEAAQRSALAELRLQQQVLGTETDDGIAALNRQLPPTAAAAACSRALIEHGFRPGVRVPAAADDLPLSLQRTIHRVLADAAAVIIEEAPAGCSCALTVSLQGDEVAVSIAYPRPPAPMVADATLSPRLRALRERVSLQGGRFRVGPCAGEWVLAVRLPHD